MGLIGEDVELLSKTHGSMWDKYKKNINTQDAMFFPIGTITKEGSREGDYEAVNLKKAIEHFYTIIDAKPPETVMELVNSKNEHNPLLPWEEVFNEGYHKKSLVIAQQAIWQPNIVIGYHSLNNQRDGHAEHNAKFAIENLANNGWLVVQNGLRSESMDEKLPDIIKKLTMTHFYADTLTRIYQEPDINL